MNDLDLLLEIDLFLDLDLDDGSVLPPSRLASSPNDPHSLIAFAVSQSKGQITTQVNGQKIESGSGLGSV